MRRRLAVTSAAAVVVLMAFGVAGGSRLDGPDITTQASVPTWLLACPDCLDQWPSQGIH